jgi:hypothetical protein
MDCHQAYAAEQAAWRSSGERPSCPCDLPDMFGPHTACYNRFVRWRRAGVWAKLMSVLAGAHDAAVQMIDTSIVRVRRWRMIRKIRKYRSAGIAQPRPIGGILT